MKENKIGFFDSGVGGITVLKRALELLPNENFIYVGDEARMPYGEKTAEEVIKYSLQIANFLVNNHNIKVLVVACNTATSVALPILQKQLNIPVIGVVDSSVSYFENKNISKIGVIATNGTVKSNAYPKALLKVTNAEVVQKGEPQFVQIAENGLSNTKETQEFVNNELRDWVALNKIETLILGCTHFPILETAIKNAIPNTEILDPGECEVNDLISILKNKDLFANKANRTIEIYTTDHLEKFQKIVDSMVEEKYEIHEIGVNEL
jgi:glutamate racemase